VPLSPAHAALGAAVRQLRTERDLSQEELGDRSGLHRNYIGGVERGERNAAWAALLRLAAGLGVPLAELVVHAEAAGATADALARPNTR